MKRLVCFLLVFTLVLLPAGAADWELEDASDIAVWREETLSASSLTPGEVKVPSALLMEKETGRVLFAQGERDVRPPASVTKIMTLLLVMEALGKGVVTMDDMVPVSAHAQSMGGSQVFMAEGERYSIQDLVKSVVIASGNDASVALAEYIAGSEESFVARMNERARELGMRDTTFLNCTGLPVDGHVTTAYDIALMSRALLLGYPAIREFTTIWMDSLRGGTFTLANTNKLIRYYPGATGLKTGSTATALYCVSGTAERDGMELIAVIMAAESSDVRFASARQLLDFGFANFALTPVFPDEAIKPIPVVLGQAPQVQPVLQNESRILVEKMKVGEIQKTITLEPEVTAPVAKGQKLGQLVVTAGDTQLAVIPLVADTEVAKLTYAQVAAKMLRLLFMS